MLDLNHFKSRWKLYC